MVGARSLAMGLNRLIDAGVDARNPRTASRELPSGALSAAQVVLFCAASLALFLAAVWQLDPIVRWLWPIPVVGFVVYPYLKRWTWLCHAWLGAVDGLAPVGAWVAVTGKLPWESWALGAAVAFWVAGFDLFYSLFDAEVDRAREPALGRHAVRDAGRLHRGAGFCTPRRSGRSLPSGSASRRGSGTGSGSPPWPPFWPTSTPLVRPGDLHRLDAAFFTMNGVIAVVFLAFVLLDVV